MKTIKVSELKVGDWVANSDGMCAEVKEVVALAKEVSFVVDGSFSLTHHGRDYTISLPIDCHVNLI